MYNKQQAIERNQNKYATTYPGPSELITQGKAEPKEKKWEKNKKQTCFCISLILTAKIPR